MQGRLGYWFFKLGNIGAKDLASSIPQLIFDAEQGYSRVTDITWRISDATPLKACPPSFYVQVSLAGTPWTMDSS